MDWQKMEKVIGETVPSCLKKLLIVCGYDTFSSITGIQNESILSIEKIVNDNFHSTVQSFDCSHADYYKNQAEFKFLPGHTDFLRGISKYKFTVQESVVQSATEFQPILQAMIDNLHHSAGKHRAKYSDLIRYFATYVFLKAGRSCYEFLQCNLPLPSTKTIRKYLNKHLCRYFGLIHKFTQ